MERHTNPTTRTSTASSPSKVARRSSRASEASSGDSDSGSPPTFTTTTAVPPVTSPATLPATLPTTLSDSLTLHKLHPVHYLILDALALVSPTTYRALSRFHYLSLEHPVHTRLPSPSDTFTGAVVPNLFVKDDELLPSVFGKQISQDLLKGRIEPSRLLGCVGSLRSYMRGLAGRAKFEPGDLDAVLVFRDEVLRRADLVQRGVVRVDPTTFAIMPGSTWDMLSQSQDDLCQQYALWQAQKEAAQGLEAAFQELKAMLQKVEATLQEKEAALQKDEAALQEAEAVLQEAKAKLQEGRAAAQRHNAAVQENSATMQEVKNSIRGAIQAVNRERSSSIGTESLTPMPSQMHGSDEPTTRIVIDEYTEHFSDISSLSNEHLRMWLHHYGLERDPALVSLRMAQGRLWDYLRGLWSPTS
ncbi:hypothetical protein IAT38_002173 [Cryptococcus sp. DSM 104549]